MRNTGHAAPGRNNWGSPALIGINFTIISAASIAHLLLLGSATHKLIELNIHCINIFIASYLKQFKHSPWVRHLCATVMAFFIFYFFCYFDIPHWLTDEIFSINLVLPWCPKPYLTAADSKIRNK